MITLARGADLKVLESDVLLDNIPHIVYRSMLNEYEKVG